MFGTPFYCGLLADQSFLLNRRADSGLMPHRVDVLRSVSNVSNRRARQEPMDDDVSSVGADSEGRPKKISRFGSKFYDGEVKVRDKTFGGRTPETPPTYFLLFSPPITSFGSTAARQCGTRTRKRWERC